VPWFREAADKLNSEILKKSSVTYYFADGDMKVVFTVEDSLPLEHTFRAGIWKDE